MHERYALPDTSLPTRVEWSDLIWSEYRNIDTVTAVIMSRHAVALMNIIARIGRSHDFMIEGDGYSVACHITDVILRR